MGRVANAAPADPIGNFLRIILDRAGVWPRAIAGAGNKWN
jgi:hypothetical protein